MQRTLLVVLLTVAVLAGLYFVLAIDNKVTSLPESQTVQNNPENIEVYSNPEIGLTFEYDAGPSGYEVEELRHSDPDSGLIRTITLYKEADRDNVPANSEGAPVIAISVFDNAQKQFPQMWADAHVAYSNINLLQGEVAESVVGGANAIRYMADGLYASENVVVAHGEFVYVITGQFMDANDAIRSDYVSLLGSVAFIPTGMEAPTVQGKIDINAVCEGALAYMTFTDGESADAFVAECKEGKHPEVIEQFKANLNLDAGVEI